MHMHSFDVTRLQTANLCGGDMFPAARAAVLLSSFAAAHGAQCFLNGQGKWPQGVTLRLQQHAWPSHKLVTNVAAIILREQLKFDVEVVETNTAPYEDIRLLADGRVDANFEVWPSGKDNIFNEWVVDRRNTRLRGTAAANHMQHAVQAGSHPVPAQSGMYVPKYVTDRNPGAEFVFDLAAQEAQSLYSQAARTEGNAASDPLGLCGQPEWNCSNFVWQPPYCKHNSCKAQMLKSNVEYDAGVFEQQLAGNGLNFTVAYLGTENLHRAVWEAYAKRQHVLFYSYTPSPGMLTIPMNQFSRVKFPPFGPGCARQTKSHPAGNASCEPKPTHLKKIVSLALANTKDAFHFAESFELGQSDYDALFEHYAGSDGDAETAACRWLRQVGSSRWEQWVKFTKRHPLLEFDKCMFLMLIQLFFGVVGGAMRARLPQTFIMKCTACMCQRRSRKNNSTVQDHGPRNLLDAETEPKTLKTDTKQSMHRSVSLLHKLGFGVAEVPVSVMSRTMSFLSYKRSEPNFLQADGECQHYPGDHTSSFRFDLAGCKRNIVQYIIASCLPQVFWASLNYSFLAGAIGSFLSLWKQDLVDNLAIDPDGLETFEMSASNVKQLVAGFSFLPLLMLSFCINREAQRWSDFVGASYNHCGRIQELALVLGGAFTGINTRNTAKQQRAVQFRFYRYLNAVHYLSYYTIDPRCQDAAQMRKDLVTVQLLTTEEASGLEYCPEIRMRELVISWISGLWHEQVKAGAVPPEDTNLFMQKLTVLRAAVIHVEKLPSLLLVMLFFTCRTLIFLILAEVSLQSFSIRQCVQPMSIITTFFIVFCYQGMLTVMHTLELTPFSPLGDCVNVDVLLCDFDRAIFHEIRQGYMSDERLDDKLSNLGNIAKRIDSKSLEHHVLPAQ